MNQYLPPYEGSGETGVGSVMSSFNLIDYIPATANKWMMTDVLKSNGDSTVSWLPITLLSPRFCSWNGKKKDIKASEQALKAGTDMDMCSNAFVKHLAKSIAEGKEWAGGSWISPAAAFLEAKYKLGLFSDLTATATPSAARARFIPQRNRRQPAM